MKASEVNFQGLLNGPTQYYVPLFQRKYCWTDEKNLPTLWNDLIDIYESEEQRSHFLGAIVLMPMPDLPAKTKKYTLIDGQQRLTTLLLLLSVIRDICREKGDQESKELAEQIMNEDLINPYNKDEKMKIVLTDTDNDIYMNIINTDEDNNNSLLLNARNYFFNNIKKYERDGDQMNLRLLKSCITDYLTLVHITLETDDSPNKIFESLNNKGLPLAVSDLIRNYFFMHVEYNDQKEVYSHYWLPIEQKMLNSSLHNEHHNVMDEFFWRFIMKDGKLVRDDDVYNEVSKDIKQKKDKQKMSIPQILKEYDRYADFFMHIIEPEKNEKNEVLKLYLNELNMWKAEVTYPFLLRIFDLKDKKEIEDDKVQKILEIIHSFLIRRYFCDKPTHILRNLFSKLIINFDKLYPIQSVIDEFRKDWPDDDTFISSLITKDIYNDSKKDRTRVILSNLERAFNHKETIKMNNKITIEHIMPQTLDDKWKKYLGKDYKNIHETFLHTLGNLTLTGNNPEMYNKSFEDKKKILSESHFELNKFIVSKAKWSNEEIVERAKTLGYLARKIWKNPDEYLK